MHLHLRVGQNSTEVARAKRKKNYEGNGMEKQKKSRIRNNLMDEISLSATTILHPNDDKLEDEISLTEMTILHDNDDELGNNSFDITTIEAVAV